MLSKTEAIEHGEGINRSLSWPGAIRSIVHGDRIMLRTMPVPLVWLTLECFDAVWASGVKLPGYFSGLWGLAEASHDTSFDGLLQRKCKYWRVRYGTLETAASRPRSEAARSHPPSAIRHPLSHSPSASASAISHQQSAIRHQTTTIKHLPPVHRPAVTSRRLVELHQSHTADMISPVF